MFYTGGHSVRVQRTFVFFFFSNRLATAILGTLLASKLSRRVFNGEHDNYSFFENGGMFLFHSKTHKAHASSLQHASAFTRLYFSFYICTLCLCARMHASVYVCSLLLLLLLNLKISWAIGSRFRFRISTSISFYHTRLLSFLHIFLSFFIFLFPPIIFSSTLLIRHSLLNMCPNRFAFLFFMHSICFSCLLSSPTLHRFLSCLAILYTAFFSKFNFKRL